MAKKQRAALICRVSTLQQVELGLESQVSILKKQAINDKYEVPDNLIFQEQISGLDAKKEIRKSLQDLMKAVENNQVDVIYTYELTRISRDPYNLVERVRWFSDRKIPMYIYDAELWTLDRNTKDEIEETTNYIFGAATYGKVEAKKIKKRTMRARDTLAEGGWYVGHLSDGYMTENKGKHKKIIKDPKREGVIIRIFELFIAGKSTDEIAQILNYENVPTTNKYRLSAPFNYKEQYNVGGVEHNRNNVKWQGTQIAQILSNKWYKGVREYKGKPYEIDQIISDEIWQKAEEMRNLRSEQFRTHRKKRKHNYLLTNYFFCGKCGQKMYGHTTGKDNHYYCSSVEFGNKCGLRGINKENIEAIVCKTIMFRALNEVLQDRKGVISEFFKINEEEKSKIKQEIKNKNHEIEIRIQHLQTNNDKRQYIIDMLSEKEFERLKNDFIKKIEDIENEQTKIENEINVLQSEISQLNKRLKLGENVTKIADRIAQMNDIGTYRKLIERPVERIEMFNVDKSISFLKITYINGKKDEIIYSYPLLHNKFIHLNSLIANNMHITYDNGSTDMQIEDGYHIALNYLGNGFMVLDDEGLEYELNKGPEWGEERVKKYYTNRISVRDFVMEARKGYPLLWDYDSSLFDEDGDERRAERAEKYKEWRKKYNNGLPTTLPYVVHDGNYEEYLAQRKHLYNRKYKIKKNKRLNAEQKVEMLEGIDRELSLLKAKVKYLSRDEAVKKFKEERKD